LGPWIATPWRADILEFFLVQVLVSLIDKATRVPLDADGAVVRAAESIVV
jgi:hypothetical protein